MNTFPDRYDPSEAEARWQSAWADANLYAFDPASPKPIFAIDTPPPTVSGEIHIGHVYSYTQAEIMARYQRMRGHNVYYPFGFDDNGLPTERFVERNRNLRAHQIGRAAFAQLCLDVSHETEGRFEEFWRGLGFSVDWRLRYSTIDRESQRISQWSFIDLYRKGHIYRATAPNPWCVECRTAIAQAEMEDAERETIFYTLSFGLPDGSSLPIATTRPELLGACVAVFVHPEDARYAGLIGQHATTPIYAATVPILGDASVDPQKGSGAVMCCTFGDATDVQWWREYQLPLIALVGRDGKLGAAGGTYAGLSLSEARTRIIADLRAGGQLQGERPAQQSVRVHERCGRPLEILESSQWYIRILDHKQTWLEAGRAIAWHPAHMQVRYEHWVQNLGWDWCISRQRFFGVPIPVWHCDACGEIHLAAESALPVDPLSQPAPTCRCGNADLRPEEDVLDTWATSSLSPQIAAQMLAAPEQFAQLFPMDLRPQAHDIIRTWAFYTIVKAHFHFGQLPWRSIMISGHALDPSGRKFSKSKGNAAVTPQSLIERHSADAVRYWACKGGLGADQALSEEAMRQGRRLMNKLWSAARFLAGFTPAIDEDLGGANALDRAWRSRLQRLIAAVGERFAAYDYPAALELSERFFWEYCDDYVELIKGRLYDSAGAERAAALSTAREILRNLLLLLAPILPHITEEIASRLFAGAQSIHLSAWPTADAALLDPEAEAASAAIGELLGAIRRHKTSRGLSVGAPLGNLTAMVPPSAPLDLLRGASTDLRSAARAAALEWAHGELGITVS